MADQPTPDQYRDVLSTIAVQAGELRDFLIDARAALESEQHIQKSAHHFYIAEQLTAFIGAIADDASGGAIVGSPASWATGLDLNSKAEVRHG